MLPKNAPNIPTQAKIAVTCDTWNDEMSTSSDFKCVGSMQMQTCVFLSHATISRDVSALLPQGLAYELLVVLGIYLHPGFKRFVHDNTK